MSDFTQMEHGALRAFLSSPGPVRSGLEKFVSDLANEHRAMCSAAMASVPRNIELASDHAAKAQMLDELWACLGDQLAQREPEPVPEEVL